MNILFESTGILRDLEIRGAGNLLGSQQSGHITAIGFDLYCQLLKQSICALRGEKIPPRVDVKVDMDFLLTNPGETTEAQTKENKKSSRRRGKESLEISIPRETAVYIETTDVSEAPAEKVIAVVKEPSYLPLDYVTEPQQRIEIYRKIAEINDTESLQSLRNELRDRYGPLPDAVERLMLLSDLKWKAFLKGISEIATQRDKLKIMRNGQWVMMSGKFPRLVRKSATAKLNEIHKFIEMFR